MGTHEGGTNGGARARLAFVVVTTVLCVAIIISVGLEWGSLLVRHQLVVSEPGTSQWQGVVALIAAIVGLLAIGFATSRARGRRAALAALLTGVVVFAAALMEVVHLVTRPADIADVVRAGAASIPLRGYRVPLIESLVGPGTWIALAAGALLALAGLVGVVVPAWRARR